MAIPHRKYIILVALVLVLPPLATFIITSFLPAPEPEAKSHEFEELERPNSSYNRMKSIEPFHPIPIGEPTSGRPWITDLVIGDLDSDGLLDIVCCEGQLNKVFWLKQIAPNEFEEHHVAGEISGPAHVELEDLDGDGDQDLIVAAMGKILPNNEKIGSVVLLVNDGSENFEKRVVLDKTYRVTDAQAADFDGDRDLDIAIGQFGYFQGAVAWLENRGNWQFEEHALLSLSGPIHTPIADVDQDGDYDIVALISQEWEEVHVFERGIRKFEQRVIYGSTNEDYGSSGISLGDIDDDGDIDIAYTNGDAFDYALPSDRPWHGLQWLENDGEGNFNFHRIGSFPGAYNPLIIDLDGDGDEDIVVVSGFNDWEAQGSVSMQVYLNNGKESFTPHAIAHEPTHLIVVDGADMDQDGKVELVTGALHAYPPFRKYSRVTLWEQDP